MPRMTYHETDQHERRERAYEREGLAVEHGGEGRQWTRQEMADELRRHARAMSLLGQSELTRQLMFAAADMLAKDDAEHFRRASQ